VAISWSVRKILNFAEVGYDEAMRRAHALVPFLREQAESIEVHRRMPHEVLEAFHRSGLMRSMQPKVWGGMELEFIAYFDIPEVLGRGDASAAWAFANFASHHRNIAQWSAKAQEEIWGENPDALIASGIAFAQGRGRRVDGGILISGEWGFSSGVDVSQWNLLSCVIMENDKPADWCMNVLPSTDYEIMDDWRTLGLRGTGSCTVKCKDVFVPAHRVQSMHVARPGHKYPGLDIHTNPMYLVPTPAVGGYCIAAALIGNAQAAVDLTLEAVKARSTNYSSAKMRDFATVQLRVGTAAAKIDGVRTWFRSDCLAAAERYNKGGALSLDEKLRYKRNLAVGMKMIIEAVDSLYEMMGAMGIYDTGPLQRVFRDAHAGGAHFSFSVDAQATPWALQALGGEFKSPTI
jgi:3-hydroxy-9,10-secoandrosta-1,3,5(10)-triene-9,17-dione monooxygenase